jgi:hypothetical protein
MQKLKMPLLIGEHLFCPPYPVHVRARRAAAEPRPPCRLLTEALLPPSEAESRCLESTGQKSSVPSTWPASRQPRRPRELCRLIWPLRACCLPMTMVPRGMATQHPH